MSPYYFEKVGVLLRGESNPGWRLIKAAAPTLDSAEEDTETQRQLQMSIPHSGCKGSLIKISVYQIYSFQLLQNKAERRVQAKLRCFIYLDRKQETFTKLQGPGMVGSLIASVFTFFTRHWSKAQYGNNYSCIIMVPRGWFRTIWLPLPDLLLNRTGESHIPFDQYLSPWTGSFNY